MRPVRARHTGFSVIPTRPLRRIALSNRMSSPSTIKTDKYAFIKYMKNIGRAHRKQAKELVSISRLFVQAQNQAFGSNTNRSLGM